LNRPFKSGEVLGCEERTGTTPARKGLKRVRGAHITRHAVVRRNLRRAVKAVAQVEVAAGDDISRNRLDPERTEQPGRATFDGAAVNAFALFCGRPRNTTTPPARVTSSIMVRSAAGGMDVLAKAMKRGASPMPSLAIVPASATILSKSKACAGSGLTLLGASLAKRLPCA
jgi:hypothetical protein